MIFVNQYWVLEFFFLDCIQFFDFFLSYLNFIWMIWHGKKIYGLSTQSILKEYVQIILFPNGYTIWTDNTVHKITHMHSVARKQSRFNSQNALTLWLPNKIAFYCYGNGFFSGWMEPRQKKGCTHMTQTFWFWCTVVLYVFLSPSFSFTFPLIYTAVV